MSKIIQLKDRKTHEVAYPATHVEAVYNEHGTKLNNLLNNKADVEDLSNVLAEQVLDQVDREEIDSITREEIKKDLFIDLWNTVNKNVGKYNPSTGYFELNGLTDITYEQAVNIYERGRLKFPYPTQIDNNDIRTNILDYSVLSCFDQAPRLQLLVRSDTIEVLRIGHSDVYGTRLSDDQMHGGLFYSLLVRAPKLRRILGIIDMNLITNPNSYLFNDSSFFPMLETIKISNLRISLKLMQCPVLSLESLQFLVANAANNSPIVVTVHSDIYQKLIDTNNTAWNKVLLDASAKDISFADGGGQIYFDGTTYNMRYNLHPMQGDTLATNICIDTGWKIPDGTTIYSNADELTGITQGKKFNAGVQEDKLPLTCQVQSCNDVTTGQYNTYSVKNGLTTGNANITISGQIEVESEEDPLEGEYNARFNAYVDESGVPRINRLEIEGDDPTHRVYYLFWDGMHEVSIDRKRRLSRHQDDTYANATYKVEILSVNYDSDEALRHGVYVTPCPTQILSQIENPNARIRISRIKRKQEIVKFDDDTVYDISFAEGWYSGEYYIHMINLNTNGKLLNGTRLYIDSYSGFNFLKENGWCKVSLIEGQDPTLTITSISSTYNGYPTMSGEEIIEVTDNIDFDNKNRYFTKCTLNGYIVVETEID